MIRLLLIVCLLNPSLTWADQEDVTLSSLFEHLNAWDLEQAQSGLSLLKETGVDPVGLLVFKARLAFLHGRYKVAISHLGQAQQALPGDKQLKSLLELYERTEKTVKDFKTVVSPKGYFVIRFQPGVDQVLSSYAGEALDAAYEELGNLLQLRPAEPIRVEIYPRVEDLAEVSPLKASEIRASGTIALCKYNRLMIVSPRALVYGYPWLDTLTHEYVHMLITKRSRNKVPIWLHEGMAKFLENRWREQKNAPLLPMSRDLLARAIKKKKLIRFEAMSPSIAKLPSQDQAALAFAQVFTVMQMLVEKGGVESLNLLIDLMRDGMSDQEAVAKVSQKSFRRFYREWRSYLYKQGYKALPDHAPGRLLFRGSDNASDELKTIPESRARSLTYLGDRLTVTKRYKAAEKEYLKAMKSVGLASPTISAKLATVLLKQGKHKAVLRVVAKAIKLDPNHVLLHLYRAKSMIVMGEYEAAKNELIWVVRINPFDTEVHELLAKVLRKLGKRSEAESARRNARLVNGS